MPLAGEQAGASGAGSSKYAALGEYPPARWSDGPPSRAPTPSAGASLAQCKGWQLVTAPGASCLVEGGGCVWWDWEQVFSSSS